MKHQVDGLLVMVDQQMIQNIQDVQTGVKHTNVLRELIMGLYVINRVMEKQKIILLQKLLKGYDKI